MDPISYAGARHSLQIALLHPRYKAKDRDGLVLAVEEVVLEAFWNGELEPSARREAKFAEALTKQWRRFMPTKFPEPSHDGCSTTSEIPRVVTREFGACPDDPSVLDPDLAGECLEEDELPPRPKVPSEGWMELKRHFEGEEPSVEAVECAG